MALPGLPPPLPAAAAGMNGNVVLPTRPFIGSINDSRGARQRCLHLVNTRDTLSRAGLIHKSVPERKQEFPCSVPVSGKDVEGPVTAARALLFYAPPPSLQKVSQHRCTLAGKRKLRHTQNPHARSHVGSREGGSFRRFVRSEEMKAQSTK